ncbi:MAG: MCE family protein [Bdellovibrionales bacterium]|nr:MCE family protein [Bdellovibrionales bacterium]
MRVKFNVYERVAGLFVLGAVVGTLGIGVAVAVKKGLFEPKIELETSLRSADGIREGTLVSMQGLRIGSVTAVELMSASEVRVRFKMERRYGDKVRADSVVRVLRPFVIGEKILDVSIGAPEALALAEGAKLPSEPTTDIMDLVSGKTLGPSLAILGRNGRKLENLWPSIF